MIKTEFKQGHFILYELVLPYCSVCTPANFLPEAWYTPVTCEESSDSEYRLWIASTGAPVNIPQPTPSINLKSRLNSSIFKCVTGSSEVTAKLKGGLGLASRGTMSIKCADFDGDPGPINFSDKGSFFGKLMARNILDGKKIITHYYSIVDEMTTPTLYEVATSTHFISNTQLTKGTFSLQAKDALKDIEAFSQQFPAPSEVELTADINATTTSIPVTDDTSFAVNGTFRIDDELFRTLSKSGNVLTVATRGSGLVNGDGTRVYSTNTDSHETGATAQQCYVMSKTPLQDVLRDAFYSVGLNAFVDYAQWTSELDQWNSNSDLYGVFSEPMKISELIDSKLRDYLVDMWLDQPTQLIKINAVTAWKEASRIVDEGDDLSSLSIKTSDNSRFSRAYIYNKKRFQTESDETQNYSKLTLHTDVATETADFYGSVKLKDFGYSNTISTASATILTSRFVQRYAKTPKEIEFIMEERKLAGLVLGDIIDITSRDTQNPDGTILSARDRAQIMRIQPQLNKIGRQYKVSALAYIPLIASGGGGDQLIITLTGTIFDENLFARAGAPNVAIDVTFIFDACTIGSTAINIPSVRAGGFPSGSNIKIICINNTTWSARGGLGGSASAKDKEAYYPGAPIISAQIGGSGGNSYESDGINTEIYLNYADVDGYSPSSTAYAPGGGGSGSVGVAKGVQVGSNFGPIRSTLLAGGGGGSGIPGGPGGYMTIDFATETPGNTLRTGQSSSGSFSSGGTSSFMVYYGDTKDGGVVSGDGVTLNVTGGKASGGASNTGAGASTSASGTSASIFPVYLVDGAWSGGQAGGMFKGTGITVYNTNASKLRDGNSDAYTLITV